MPAFRPTRVLLDAYPSIARAKPFPYTFHVGTDICHIPRIRKLLSNKLGDRFIRFILSPRDARYEEMIYTQQNWREASVDPQDRLDQLSRLAQWMAGRFAAKEAIIKAHPLRRLTWHEIAICRHDGRQHYLDPSETTELNKLERDTFSKTPMPRRTVEGVGEKAVAHQPIFAIVRGQIKGGPEHGSVAPEQEARLSISHDGEYATATAIGFGDSISLLQGEGQAELITSNPHWRY